MTNDCRIRPEVSVIITSFNEKDTIEWCLVSLEEQDTRRPFEVIVVDNSNDGAEEIARRFPFVRVKHFSERKYCGEARNEGIALAGANIIAFLDADCVVSRNWIEEIVQAHQSAHLAIGGVIENGTPERLVGWAYYFCEFNLWLPAAKPRLIPEIAGCCLSMKRYGFDRYGPFLSGTYCADTALLRNMARDGHLVQFSPAIRIYHRAVKFGIGRFLSHVFQHRKAYARVTAQQFNLSLSRRILNAAGKFLMPIPLFLLIASRIARSGYAWNRFAAASPLVLAGVIARCLGELIGYLQRQSNSLYQRRILQGRRES
jgi:glycosyltransferase involved in cell wall biosynthesis